MSKLSAFQGVPLPSVWPEYVKLAVIHSIALAHRAITYSRSFAINSSIERVRLTCQLDNAQNKNALLREEIRIKDVRMAKLSPRRRPQYSPQERMAILELRAARAWNLAETARTFMVEPETIASWMKRAANAEDGLLELSEPVNKYPDYVRYIIQRLRTLCPTMGKVRIAQILARAGLHLGATTVGRILKDNGEASGEQFNQSIWNGERYYSVGRWYSQQGVAQWSGGTATTGEFREADLRSIHVGAELNGVLRSDHEPYYKILEDAKEIKVRIDQETFDVATYHVEATTKRGFYQVWIDPEQNYHIRRAIVERRTEDLGSNDVPISEYEWSPKESMRYTLTNDKFDTIDGHIFPVEGRAVFEAVFLNGGPGGSLSVEAVTDIRITSIELNPDFSALRAFTLDAPPMTVLTDWSNDNKDLVWTGSSLSDDEALIEEATRTQAAVQDAAMEPRPKRTPIYDPDADAKQDIADAVARAAKDNKRVLIQWGANWCSWCYKLHDCFNQNEAISRILSYEYELVMVDSDTNAELKKSYGATYGGVPFLTILDASGAVIKNQNRGPLEVGSKHDPAKVEAFLTAWKAEPLDADDVLKSARVKASEENKLVFLLFGAPWCGWCHRLEDFLAQPEINAIIQDDYVLTKIDTERMTKGHELLEKVNTGAGGGIPWFAITDGVGAVLITSTGPEGNCGYPVRASEIAHFVTMLSKTAKEITPERISFIESALKAEAEKILQARR